LIYESYPHNSRLNKSNHASNQQSDFHPFIHFLAIRVSKDDLIPAEVAVVLELISTVILTKIAISIIVTTTITTFTAIFHYQDYFNCYDDPPNFHFPDDNYSN